MWGRGGWLLGGAYSHVLLSGGQCFHLIRYCTSPVSPFHREEGVAVREWVGSEREQAGPAAAWHGRLLRVTRATLLR